MPEIKEIDFNQIISTMPNIQRIPNEYFVNMNDSLFLCALGFEDRCLKIPSILAHSDNYLCKQSIYFEYSTNKEDSSRNFESLNKSLLKISNLSIPMECDVENFYETFRNHIASICQNEENPKILFDISTCSSKLLLTVLKVLFEFDIQLKIVYTEAELYHPTFEEINTPEKFNEWTKDETFGLSRGIADYTSSRGFPGNNIDALPNAIIVFASFKPERNENAIIKADEILLSNPGKRVIWIIGKPHNEEDDFRVKFLIESNNISDKSPVHILPTFDYKETLELLNKIYDEYNFEYHLFISPLGSKLQSVGVALFHFIKPDITINFSQPKEYNANRFSEGYRNSYYIDFKSIRDLRERLNLIGFWEMEGFLEYLK